MGNFLENVEAWIAGTPGMTASKLGFEALRDYSFVATLRSGRSPTLQTVERVEAYMRRYSGGDLPALQGAPMQHALAAARAAAAAARAAALAADNAAAAVRAVCPDAPPPAES